jgi:hypothetical protein
MMNTVAIVSASPNSSVPAIPSGVITRFRLGSPTAPVEANPAMFIEVNAVVVPKPVEEPTPETGAVVLA